ncbi:histone deacetylase [Candidatus Aerophobetes bacterium]|nr:histone deacetylase [Candidatus Aerophobetes bacterium]
MIFFSLKCLEYSFPGHPESAERVKSIYNHLKDQGYTFEEAKPCREDDILLVHTKGHLKKVKENTFFDPDTPNLENIYDYAALAVGGAIQAVDKALEGENSFSLLRPPGHHAGKNYLGGFCYFNNIAIATCRALRKGVDKVAIIDFDGHHGNGTEDIFSGEKRVLYLSLHQYPAYPGTGGSSRGNSLNFPLSPGCEEEDFMRAFFEGINEVEEFSPGLIGVSAGFDAHEKDPLLSLNLKTETYFKIGEKISSLKKPFFCVLEGGYHEDLPFCVRGFFEGAGIK